MEGGGVGLVVLTLDLVIRDLLLEALVLDLVTTASPVLIGSNVSITLVLLLNMLLALLALVLSVSCITTSREFQSQTA